MAAEEEEEEGTHHDKLGEVHAARPLFQRQQRPHHRLLLRC
jgi:hypothetical protein